MKNFWNMKIYPVLLLFFMLIGTACTNQQQSSNQSDTSIPKVEIRNENGRYQLYRDNEPYVIKGAGLQSWDVETLARHNGNSFRTWSTDNAQELLDKAQELGMTVTMCIWIAPERMGFDYNDEDKVKEQFERAKSKVLKYKDHPALLMWAIGNELDHNYTNPMVYDAVNDISKMIHELDPYHPTTTIVTVLNKKLADDIRERASDLDVLSMQMYGAIFALRKFIEESEWTTAYMITEWGAIGHWEMGMTSWGAPVEQTSTAKAKTYLNAYNTSLRDYTDQCIGNYVFLWGQKQERTPTWYGMFLKSGEETEAVDVMHYIWNGEWPKNRTPKLDAMKLDGKAAEENIKLASNMEYQSFVDVTDPDGDPITYLWEIRPESTERSVGGDYEETPEVIDGLITDPTLEKITLRTPEKEGAYRLFVYAFDGNNHAAHANIPFYVESK